MPLYYNNAQVRKMTYNGTELKVCNYNNVKVFSSVPDWYNTLKSMSIGGTITIDSMVWIVVHKTSSAAVLGLNTIYSDTEFGSKTTYNGSTLASVAANFEANNLSASTKALLNNVTVNNVTAKCFVPSYEQMTGGFSHYNIKENRVCQYQGKNYRYWTSSSYNSSYAWRVNNTGALARDIGPSSSCGFRPHIEVNLTL